MIPCGHVTGSRDDDDWLLSAVVDINMSNANIVRCGGHLESTTEADHFFCKLRWNLQIIPLITTCYMLVYLHGILATPLPWLSLHCTNRKQPLSSLYITCISWNRKCRLLSPVLQTILCPLSSVSRTCTVSPVPGEQSDQATRNTRRPPTHAMTATTDTAQ